ncbi:N-acetylmuramoyl-L-alanine amidase [Sphingomonas sp. LHG3406-1]|uniref:N-acetylmuramoyl-L-alanine amidase family protein n=1 Tax=Sphingomonas sp. LHG3406-1 TaxID=2804617 RepID=UPI002604254D|nr:N-acetylmuramoyl-L-alanine amidase [Sphingomonas sp. LHG3406-1]
MTRRTALRLALIGLGGLLLAGAAALWVVRGREGGTLQTAVAGEAREGGLSLSLAPAVAAVRIVEAKVPGRPLIVIDPGHGGRDPGAPGASGRSVEKDVTLLIARELRDELARRGRVRIALTRDGDGTLTLDDRAAIARRLGANLFLAIHADSAPNPGARGATAYSLSEVASDADAAMLAARENGEGAVATERDGSVRALLSDLAARDEMAASADFAIRVIRAAEGSVPLRPEPHRFAAFRVLRRSDAPAVLFEAGYLSNAADEAMLLDPIQRRRMVEALARAIEAQAATRR